VCRGNRWELITVALVARSDPREVPAYGAVLQRHIDSKFEGAVEVTESHGRHRYAVSRRALSRKELLALPIPIEWLK
jgi:hypothetical protein